MPEVARLDDVLDGREPTQLAAVRRVRLVQLAAELEGVLEEVDEVCADPVEADVWRPGAERLRAAG